MCIRDRVREHLSCRMGKAVGTDEHATTSEVYNIQHKVFRKHPRRCRCLVKQHGSLVERRNSEFGDETRRKDIITTTLRGVDQGT